MTKQRRKNHRLNTKLVLYRCGWNRCYESCDRYCVLGDKLREELDKDLIKAVEPEKPKQADKHGLIHLYPGMFGVVIGIVLAVGYWFHGWFGF